MRTIDFIFLAVILIGTALYIWFKNRRPKPKKSRTRTETTRAETAALEALTEAGYVLQETHPVIPVTLNVDGEKRKDLSHAGNLIVRKKGRTYLVKVVRGDNVSPLASASLRKELLLDHLFFLPHGIIVYNVNNNRIQEVTFSFAGFSGREKMFTRIALVLLILAGLAMLMFFVYKEVFVS